MTTIDFSGVRGDVVISHNQSGGQTAHTVNNFGVNAPSPLFTFTSTLPSPGATTMSVHPLRDLVLIRRAASQTITSSGLILAGMTEKSRTGEVVAVGPGRVTNAGERVPPLVKTGDQVLFSGHTETEVNFDGDDLLLLEEADILGIFE